MKAPARISLALLCLCTAFACSAIDLKQAKLTQVVNDVEIISAAAQTKKDAQVNDIFTMPDILRTGAASRAELVAADQTVTRVGANTIFSFDEANRTIDLQQGSLLFHSPHGKGGGTIHTGSATASVLGTTLIVVTTPNGGFKVLDLEGEVEIKFLNGLKQDLQPGQMTFILPDGNHASPIIVFRLDTLTKNSLLVNGFLHQLDSMPLILRQIERQLKLIKSGRATDTGLFAGDNAGPNSVEVIDPNSIQSKFTEEGVKNALLANATINRSSLSSPWIPIPPPRLFFDPPFTLDGNDFYNGQSFQGFAGMNIFFNTPKAKQDALSVNLEPYAKHQEFDFVASVDLKIEGSVIFNGLPEGNKLSLVAGRSIVISPNTTVVADTGDFNFSAPRALSLDQCGIVNNIGNIGLHFGSGISLNDGVIVQANGLLNVQAGFPASATPSASVNPQSESLGNAFSGNQGVSISDSAINSANNFWINSSGGEVNVNNSTLISGASLFLYGANGVNVNNSTLQASGTVEMDSPGSVNVTATSITANVLTLNSGDGILLDANGHTLATTGVNPTANLTAVNTATVNNADLTGFSTVNMAANTIVLANVAFAAGSSVNLQSLNGVLAPNPNTYASVVPGDVNFIHDVTYGGNPAQNYVGSGITISPLP